MSIDSTALGGFPPESFTILAFCEACGHSGSIDRRRVPQNFRMEAVVRRLRCTACGVRDATIRIVYTGSGGFRYGATARQRHLDRTGGPAAADRDGNGTEVVGRYRP